jgi:glycosyltransferase involved in cell wall biosynthesis
MTKQLHNVHIARVSTVPLFMVTLLRTQLQAINNAGATVTVICSNDELSDSIYRLTNCQFKPLYIAREISLMADAISLLRLIRIFYSEKYDIVHSTTPKAGLLCAIAAKLAGVPIRIHTFTGQSWVTANGIKKAVLKFCDKLIGLLNIHCYADSRSQLDFLVRKKIVDQTKIAVIGEGSVAGVDIERFNEKKYSEKNKKDIRTSLNINDSSLILLFVGRVTKDKGIFELVESVGNLIRKGHDVVLLIVGPFEKGLESQIRAHGQKLCEQKVVFEGFSSEPENFMAVADILCLPSYREGFGSVVIEAAAMGVPAVGTRIYGLVDAIVDGVTGLLIEPRNIIQLTAALERLVSDDQLRMQMKRQAKKRALSLFNSVEFGKLWVNEYEKLISEIKKNSNSQ